MASSSGSHVIYRVIATDFQEEVLRNTFSMLAMVAHCMAGHGRLMDTRRLFANLRLDIDLSLC